MCMHKQPISVFHVVSLTVPSKTAPVSSNPFEDEEDEEEEMDEEQQRQQQTIENHVTVKKEEIKTLVNRREALRPPAASLPLSLFFFTPWIRAAPLVFLGLSYSPPSCVVFVFSSSCKLLCCSAWFLSHRVSGSVLHS